MNGHTLLLSNYDSKQVHFWQVVTHDQTKFLFRRGSQGEKGRGGGGEEAKYYGNKTHDCPSKCDLSPQCWPTAHHDHTQVFAWEGQLGLRQVEEAEILECSA